MSNLHRGHSIPTFGSFGQAVFLKWPPQYRKKSSSEFVTMQSVHLNLLSVAGLGDFIIVSNLDYNRTL
jgi:hypothetical protein